MFILKARLNDNALPQPVIYAKMKFGGLYLRKDFGNSIINK